MSSKRGRLKTFRTFKEVDMLNGYRTYISAGLMALYNIARALGITEVSSQEMQAAVDIVVNVILGLLALLFRFKATAGKAGAK